MFTRGPKNDETRNKYILSTCLNGYDDRCSNFSNLSGLPLNLRKNGESEYP